MIIESGQTVGIVVAMASEGKHLLPYAENVEYRSTSAFPSYLFTIGGTRCVMVRSGIGMVHAAAGTQALISQHHPSVVLNFGCTGAHRRDIRLGDVVIGDRCIYHAAIQVLPDGLERYVGFTNEEGSDIAHVSDFDAVTTNPTLVQRALAVAQRDGIEPWPDTDEPLKAVVGPVASADVWTQKIERLDAIHSRHGTLCEDMEAAAIGRIAQLHDLPFLTIKDISNNEFLRASNLFDFSDFPVQEVGKRAAAVVAGLITSFGDPASDWNYSRYSSSLTVINR